MSSGARSDDPRISSLLVDTLEGASVALIGFPFDEGTVLNGGREGGRLGPEAFRRFLPKMGAVINPEHGVDMRGLRIAQLGDAEGSCAEEGRKSLEALVLSALKANVLPFCVGGSNDQSYANAAGLLAFLSEHKPDARVGVINIDAHLDVRPPLPDGRHHSGSPFRRLLEDPRFAALGGTFVEFAAQGSQCASAHAKYVESKGGSIVWLSRLRDERDGGKSLAVLRFAEVLRAAGDFVFVSFDIDSIASSDCPGVSCPATVGLSAHEALEMCRHAGSCSNVVMVDVSELNPMVEDYRTPRLVVNMLYSFLLGFSSKGRRGSLRV